jgi:2-oxoglutarate dehydrogenase E2 component (dihydrolipoamide succinyltransferase)
VSSSTTDRRLLDVVMPQLGVSVTEGTLLAWHRDPGAALAADEPLCEVSTDKVDSEVPAPAAGILAERLVEAGETVPVGSVIARIAVGADAAPAPRRRLRRLRNGTRVSPVVARIAAAERVDLDAIRGSGRDGRVTKRDLLGHLGADRAPAAAGSSPSPPGGEPLSPIRQAIARAMTSSQQEAATCTTIVEVEMSRVEAARARDGLTYLPYVAAATVAALGSHPALNATIGAGPPEQLRIERHDSVDLGIAVSLGEDGLIVPVLRDAGQLSPRGISERIADLSGRARENRLEPDEVGGGTFTITNPGAAGAIAGTPIINRPQVAILDVEAVVRRPVAVGDAIAIRPIAYFCLSWDHRAIDGMAAAHFLAEIRQRLEDLT